MDQSSFALIVAAARREVEKALASADRKAVEAFAPAFVVKDGHLLMQHGGTVSDLGEVVGPRGLDGFGIDGKDGESIKGDDGRDGRDGIDGKDGKSIKGQDGRDGKDGEDGISITGAKVSDKGFLVISLSDGRDITAGYVKGPKGDKGDRGASGMSGGAVMFGGGGSSSGGGSQGQDGASAYDVATENGFSGSEAEWLASLVGPKGDAGDKGEQGLKGDTGDVGPTPDLKTIGGESIVGDGDFELFRGLALPMKPAAGVFFGPATSGAALGTVAQVANRNTIAPFISGYDTTIDQVAISVSTAVASSLAKVVIYSADANGRPDAVVAEGSDIDCASTGTKTSALAFTFQAGRVYWIGVRSSSTQTLRSLPAAAFPVLSYTTAATPVIQTVLVKTETYATAAAAWGYSSSHHSNLTVPMVLMRVA